MDLEGNWVLAVLLCIAIAIVSYCLIKGVLKLFYALLCLVGLVLGGFLGFAASNHFAPQHWPNFPVYGHYLIGCICALLSFFGLKYITHFLYDPVPNGPNGQRPPMFTIIAGVCLLGAFCIAVVIISSNKKFIEKSPEWVKSSLPAIQEKLNEVTDTAAPQIKGAFSSQVQKLIGSSDDATDTLAQLSEIKAKDPEAFKKIAKNAEVKRALEHPKVQAFLEDPEILQQLKEGKLTELMLNPKAQEILADEQLQLAIAQIDIEQVLKLR
ncbi:hypothetical protein [Rubritalea marina]|uniref:hypothetical protein n=1 Tax=Rubritalea marina TaxID=361055 RepID=UPI00036EE51B|nr:hypothetical protein [Rubritalea marina]